MTVDTSQKPCSIGIDFGGTSVKIGSLSEMLSDENQDPKVLITSDYDSVQSLITAMVDVVNEFREDQRNIVTLGCGVPGLVDFEFGHIHTLTNVPGWNNIPFREILEQRLQIPIFVDNDANCMAYAEYRYGAAKGCSNVVALTLGTGIGGGLIIGGELYRGSDFAAGELGNHSIDYQGPKNTYGLRGALECYMGNRQICELASERFDDRQVPEGGWNPKLVTSLATEGDPIAIEIWDQVAEWLASALASTAWLLNPDAFIIGGGIACAGDFLFEPLRNKINNQVSDVIAKDLKILPAHFGKEAGIIGSAAQALDQYNQS